MVASIGFSQAQLFVPRSAGLGSRSTHSTSGTPATREDLVRLRRNVFSLLGLTRSLETELSKRGTRLRLVPAVARSSSDLGIESVGTPTTLTSTEEVNATPTSFSPFGPSFRGASQSEPTVTGVYDGSDGSDTLKFEIGKTETIGSNTKAIKVEVRDGGGTKIDQFTINPGTPADTPFTLDNGLIVSFSTGSVFKNDFFEVDVSDRVGSAVDPDKSFDGTRNDNPNLEYPTSVRAGSFEVNGVSIMVNGSDTLNDVLARITSSDAGVTAEFDAGTETVSLSQKSLGPGHDIVVGNDTSSFLVATKLAGALAVPGQDGDPLDEVISNVQELAGITSGNANINGVSIRVDVASDTLGDVLTRINASPAGVTATFSNQRVTIQSANGTTPVILDDGDTGLFSTLLIEPGTYAPKEGRSVASGAKAARLLKQIATAFGTLFNDTANADSSHLSSLRAGLQGAVQRSLDVGEARVRTEFGGNFDFRESAERVFDFRSGHESRLRAALRSRPDEVRRFFTGPRARTENGLLGEVIDALSAAEDRMQQTQGASGSTLDLLA